MRFTRSFKQAAVTHLSVDGFRSCYTPLTPFAIRFVAKGILDDAKLTDHREALAQHLKDPATIVIDKLLVQCWGQKPR